MLLLEQIQMEKRAEVESDALHSMHGPSVGPRVEAATERRY